MVEKQTKKKTSTKKGLNFCTDVYEVTFFKLDIFVFTMKFNSFELF